jgi:hypothetical protein
MFAAAHRRRNAIRRRIHISQARRVWHQGAQLRFQEVPGIIHANAARGQQAPKHLRQFKPLRDAKPNARIASAPLPTAPSQAARDTKYGALRGAVIHAARLSSQAIKALGLRAKL